MEEDTANLTLAYAASTNSSGIEGRAICNARTNHWVSDDGGGDAVYSGELFLSGISLAPSIWWNAWLGLTT